MQIVTDGAADLAPEQMQSLEIHKVPLSLTLDGKTYTSGVDIQPAEFYALLENTSSFPTTSQPTTGEFAALYKRLAQTDPEILSIHIASGLSGTLNAARSAASLVPEARVTFFDSHTLSVPLGWMVQAAARAIQAKWDKERILNLLDQISARSQGLFTLSSLSYLIHGGRISHLKGLMASVLNIKPIIGPNKEDGKYITFAQEVTLKRALYRLPEILIKLYGEGNRLRIQLLHGQNPDGAEILHQALSNKLKCSFEPLTVVAPVLGAHTGPSIIGLGAGEMDAFAGLI